MTENITLEVLWFTIATNLASFGLGMLVVVIQFDIYRFITEIDIYLLPAILLGIGAMCYWGYVLFRDLAKTRH